MKTKKNFNNQKLNFERIMQSIYSAAFNLGLCEWFYNQKRSQTYSFKYIHRTTIQEKLYLKRSCSICNKLQHSHVVYDFGHIIHGVSLRMCQFWSDSDMGKKLIQLFDVLRINKYFLSRLIFIINVSTGRDKGDTNRTHLNVKF